MRGFLFLLVAVGSAVTALACSSSSSSPSNGPAPTGKDQATVDQGKASVTSRQCVKCHGENMAGALQPLQYPQDGGPQDPNVELYPPNLTPDPTYGVASWTDDQLAFAIRHGIDDQGLQLCPQMQHFSTMNDYETYSIVKYLRSIPPVPQKVLRSVCPPLKTKEEQEAGVP